MNIAIFGGSFNPVHKGHIEIVRKLLHSQKVSRVIVVPARRNPFKEAEPGLPDDVRWQMLTVAFAEVDRVEISDYELQQPGPSYTYRTLSHFAGRHAHDHLFLVVGEDAFESFPHWTAVDKIIQLSRIIVLPRPGQRKKNNPTGYTHGYGDRVEWFNCEIPDISATSIRNSDLVAIAQNRWLTPAVFELWRQYKEKKI